MLAAQGGRVAFTAWGRTPAFSVIEDAWRVNSRHTKPCPLLTFRVRGSLKNSLRCAGGVPGERAGGQGGGGGGGCDGEITAAATGRRRYAALQTIQHAMFVFSSLLVDDSDKGSV